MVQSRRPTRATRRKPANKKPAPNKKLVAKKKTPVAKKKPVARKKSAAKKESVAKPLAPKKPLRRPFRARSQPNPSPPPAPRPAPTWPAALRAELASTGDDFATYLRGLRADGWEHADTPELAGLERWGTDLATRDRLAGIGALVSVAGYGIAFAIASGGIGLEGMGFLAAETVAEGAPVERQIELAAAWLDAPDAAHLAAVVAATDRSQRTPIWDDDLRPSDDRAHWWYVDVGQCCCHAIVRTGGDPGAASSSEWDPATCVGRGLVVAVRGLRHKGAHVATLLADIRRAMTSVTVARARN